MSNRTRKSPCYQHMLELVDLKHGVIAHMIQKLSTRREQNRKINIRKLELTERIPQPVGTNAKMHAKRSTIEREVTATATAMAATTSKNTEALRRRSSSWKCTMALGFKPNT
jgi:hypothetical protein